MSFVDCQNGSLSLMAKKGRKKKEKKRGKERKRDRTVFLYKNVEMFLHTYMRASMLIISDQIFL